ncbi:acetoacetyl-CoA reductase [Legionella spiritensis]|uniref:Acetyoacetyl CoA reductase n=1 Tax=Legionella spiritensis TaxID=452 RepID=A0A0W0Z6N4_LEGSP|nr:acetoacetyl-CoA reductase [Legionella spiritensis]KTD64777.1 acetyoacetyl CoA reductase [Legionella spiritensis]SNV39789.1 Acetoacetyl-CoA reductase [Legionella spiritensis]VEG90418.1 Acetoacetyl-CoA reductase [Legionella spiritensis]
MEQMTAIVTGGTGGIGTAICRSLAASNYRVIACYFKDGNHEEAKLWQSSQKKDGFNIDIQYADVRQFEDCEKLARVIKEQYGRIDVLVNNAGVTRDMTLKKMTPKQWQLVLDANLNSVFNVTRNVLPLMLEREYGRIISISSVSGRKGQAGQCNYAATKAALLGFSKSLALETADKGITVNTISPGYIETPMLAAMRESVLKALITVIPMGRLGKPEEIARAVTFLASPDSGFITGANLDINGGQYM